MLASSRARAFHKNECFSSVVHVNEYLFMNIIDINIYIHVRVKIMQCCIDSIQQCIKWFIMPSFVYIYKTFESKMISIALYAWYVYLYRAVGITLILIESHIRQLYVSTTKLHCTSSIKHTIMVGLVLKYDSKCVFVKVYILLSYSTWLTHIWNACLYAPNT